MLYDQTGSSVFRMEVSSVFSIGGMNTLLPDADDHPAVLQYLKGNLHSLPGFLVEATYDDVSAE